MNMYSEYFVGICILFSNIHQVYNIIIHPILTVLLYLSPYQSYTIETSDVMEIFKSKFKPCICFSYDDQSNPLGYIISYDPKSYSIKYIAYVNSYKYSESMLIITTKSLFENTMNRNNKDLCIQEQEEFEASIQKIENHNDKNSLQMYTRYGEYSYLRYHSADLFIEHTTFTSQQNQLYLEIIKQYKTRPNLICYLYGKTGCGKTYFSYLLANKMKGTLCTTFKPTDPGDHFERLYRSVNPTKCKPLIILMDEIDVLIESLHTNKIVNHKNIPVPIKNKHSWNSFLDEFDYGIWRNVIVILCSNKTASYIDSLDMSYLREGRIQIKKEFDILHV